jgi:hypothetical protein
MKKLFFLPLLLLAIVTFAQRPITPSDIYKLNPLAIHKSPPMENGLLMFYHHPIRQKTNLIRISG